MNEETTPCPKCGHPTVGRTVWEAMPKPRAARRRDTGGNCQNCARASWEAGERVRRPAVPLELVLLDWHWLHETHQLHEDQPLKHRIQVAAPRIGMTVAALEKALLRAGVTNPAEPATMARPDRGTICQVCRQNRGEVYRAEREHRQAARWLAVHPDSERLQGRLAEMSAALDRSRAQQQWHLDTEHQTAAA